MAQRRRGARRARAGARPPTFDASGKPAAVRAEPVTFDASGKPVDVHAEPETKLGPWYVEAIYSLKDFMKEHIRLYNFLRRRIAWRLMARPDASGDVRSTSTR